MAAEYARKATYGNVAYDFERVRRGYEVEIPAETVKEPAKVKKAAVKKVYKTAQRTRSISVFSVVGFLAIAVLVVLILLANVQLTEISSNATQARESIAALEQEQAQLLVEYETTFNLNEIRNYAIDKLGMVEAVDGEMVTVGGVSADKAIVLGEASNGGDNVFSGIKTFLTSIREYFN